MSRENVPLNVAGRPAPGRRDPCPSGPGQTGHTPLGVSRCPAVPDGPAVGLDPASLCDEKKSWPRTAVTAAVPPPWPLVAASASGYLHRAQQCRPSIQICAWLMEP
jgi:hypothetical protein